MVDNEERYISAKEFAARIDHSREFVYIKAKTGEIQSVRMGRSIRFPVSAVERWLKSRPSGEIEDV